MPRRKCAACSKEFSCRQSLFVHKKKCGGNVQIENYPPQNERNMEESSNFENKCNDILSMVKHLNIPNFEGSFRCDELYGIPQNKECGIVYLSPDHLASYYKDNDKRIYFDTLGQEIPTKIQKYLKTEEEFQNEAPVIQRNTDIVQEPNTEICGHLCLYVLDKLSKGAKFQEVINSLKW